VSIIELLDGSKLDECELHEPCVWGRGWTLLAIHLWKNSTKWGWKIFLFLYKLFEWKRKVLDDIWEHFLCDEIKKNYRTWIWHGELTDMQMGFQTKSINVEMRDRLEDMIYDLGQEYF